MEISDIKCKIDQMNAAWRSVWCDGDKESRKLMYRSANSARDQVIGMLIDWFDLNPEKTLKVVFFDGTTTDLLRVTRECNILNFATIQHGVKNGVSANFIDLTYVVDLSD